MTMQHRSLWITTCWVLLASLAVLSRPAHAYIDPGTGSYMLQLLLAGALAAAFILRASWARVKDAFRRACSWRQRDEAQDD